MEYLCEGILGAVIFGRIPCRGDQPGRVTAIPDLYCSNEKRDIVSSYPDI
jgi:hypothetical protein